MKPIGVAALVGVAACATTNLPGPEPLSMEFGQDAYLTAAYLESVPGVECGIPMSAPGGAQVRGPLPDGSWFSLFAVPSTDGAPDTVVLERGWEGQESQLTVRLDSKEGIVRLKEGDRRDAWGVNHPWADWMRGLGMRVLSLGCPAV